MHKVITQNQLSERKKLLRLKTIYEVKHEQMNNQNNKIAKVQSLNLL